MLIKILVPSYSSERRRSTRDHGRHLGGVAAGFWSRENLDWRVGAASETPGRDGDEGLSFFWLRRRVRAQFLWPRRRGRAKIRWRICSSAADSEGGLSFFLPRQRVRAQIRQWNRLSEADSEGSAQSGENDDGSNAAVGGSVASRPPTARSTRPVQRRRPPPPTRCWCLRARSARSRSGWWSLGARVHPPYAGLRVRAMEAGRRRSRRATARRMCFCSLIWSPDLN
jgi:hypothetical protein